MIARAMGPITIDPSPMPDVISATARLRCWVNQRDAMAVSGAKNAPAASPPQIPHSNWNCQICVTRLAAIKPLPNSTPPQSNTERVPNRSETAPQKKEPKPMNRNVSTAADETSVRDQPMAMEIGCRKTPSDMAVPRPMQVMTKPAATTIQP